MLRGNGAAMPLSPLQSQATPFSAPTPAPPPSGVPPGVIAVLVAAGAGGAAYATHAVWRRRQESPPPTRLPERVDHEERLSVNSSGDSRTIFSRQPSSQQIPRLSGTRHLSRISDYSIVQDVLAPHINTGPGIFERWCQKYCNPCVLAWRRASRSASFLGMRLLPNDRRQVLLLAASVAIYYIDMCSDLVVCIIFYNKHHYWYMLLTIVAVLLGAGRSYYRTQADTGFFFLEPARLALQAFMLEVSPAGMKTQWDNNDLHVSRMRMQRLSELGQQMWEVTRFEAETQSAVNMLVQFYTVCHESYEPSVVATLLLSATISFLSVLKSLRAFDSRGHVTWQVQTNDGPFPYVFGVGLPSNVSALVSLFRAVEVASRIGTLATAQALLRHGFPQDFGTDLVFPVLLGESVLLLFVASECYPRPRHMWHCLMGAIFFPAPLVAPPWVKTSMVCSASFYTIRVMETLIPWAAMLTALHLRGLPPPSPHEMTLLWIAACCSLLFVIAAPLMIVWLWNYDYIDLRREVAAQLKTDRKGNVIWPASNDGNTDIWQVLRGYGFFIPAPDLAEQMDSDDEVWEVNPTHAADLTCENICFNRSYALDDSKADLLMRRFSGVNVERLVFMDCQNVSADAWRDLLNSIAPSSIKELGLVGSGKRSMLDEEKAEAVADVLTEFLSLRILNFSYNRQVNGHGWMRILDAVRGTGIEELSLKECDLDEGKAQVVGQGLQKLSQLKKADFSRNGSLPANGWQSLLNAVDAQVEELSLQSCNLDTVKIDAIAYLVPSFKTLRKMDLSSNSDIVVAGWTQLIGALRNTPIEELGFADCNLDEESAKAIADCLKYIEALRGVDFANNKRIGVHAWRQLMESLTGPEISELSFGSCGLNDEEAEAIMESLTLHKKLWKLDFSLNSDVAPFFWIRLADCLALCDLDLTGCNLAHHVCSALIASMGSVQNEDHRVRFCSSSVVARSLFREAPCGSETKRVRLLQLELTGYSNELAFSCLEKFCFLEELRLKITSEHTLALRMMMQNSSAAMRCLDLKGSNISSIGWRNVFIALNGVHIEELNLQGCDLDDSKVEGMAEVRPALPKLRRVNVRNNSELTPRGWTMLLQALGRSPVEEIDDVFRNMDEAKARAIAVALPALQGLRRVDFSYSRNVSEEAWRLLIGSLSGRDIEVLNLEHCELDDPKAIAIADKLPDLHIHNLQKVSLIGKEETTQPTIVVNIINAAGLRNTEWLGKPDPYCVCQIKENPRSKFRTKTISDALDPVWNQEFKFKIHSESESLEFFVMDEAVDSKTQDEQLGSATLENYEYYPGGFSGEMKLHRPKKKGQTVGTIIPPTLVVKVKVLPQVRVSAWGLRCLLVSMDGAKVEDLGHIFNELDGAKASAVAEALPGLRMLKRLDFSNSWSVSARGWEQVLGALKGSNVEKLVFCKCRLNDAKANALAEALPALPAIQELDMGWNREVSGAGWASILHALQDTQIRKVNLDYCLLNDNKVDQIAEVVPYIKTLSTGTLSLAGNFQITESGQKHLARAFQHGQSVGAPRLRWSQSDPH